MTATAPPPTRAAHLEAWLAERGLSTADLLGLVETAFGRPIAVVASGSVVHGYGNTASDLDIEVVVEGERAASLPLPAFAARARIDFAYRPASKVEAQIRRVAACGWPPASVPREEWLAYRSALTTATRLLSGCRLMVRPEGEALLSVGSEGGLPGRIAPWWQVEAQRRLTAARWLATPNPRLGAHRYGDAVLAALECRAAARGHVYLGAKWLGEKLRAVDDAEGLALLRLALRPPYASGRAEHAAWAERALEGLLPRPPALAAELWLAPGVSVHRAGRSLIFARWGMRAVEARIPEGLPEGGEPLWRGPLRARPPLELATLFAADFLWLGLAEGGE